MATFTILSVEPETRRWGDKNDMIAYRVSLSGEQGTGKSVELSRHEKQAPPRPDEVVDGELKEYPPHGWKLVKPKGAAPRSFSSSGGGGKASEFRSPEQIMRSDAHGKAMHWCDIKVAAGEWTPINWEQYVAMVDRYYADIKGAS